ncbi:acid protease [Clavulina sp. PMI_390]|nr:acid protease [Clavulina sp. PMI_390]
MLSTAGLLLSAFIASARAAPSLAIDATSASFQFFPSGSWKEIAAPGAYGGTSRFLLAQANMGTILITLPSASSMFQLWGYQRSDGGLYSLSFDSGSPTQVDVYNATSTGTDPPRLLYSTTNLSNSIHTINITNLYDSRTSKYGQMNMDHIVINSADSTSNLAPTFPSNPAWTTETIESAYHVKLALGANSPANGGSGQESEVLFDTGAGGAWVVWNGCTESQCANHNDYVESSHVINETIIDTIVYGSGGPANTMVSYRVNDTVTFGSFSVETSFGASYSIPSGGESIDGNFGMARSYCNGKLCSNYPNFVEVMYQEGIISSPVIAFYLLASTDDVPANTQSEVAIGALDASKYTGSMDWIPLTSTDSMWISPGNTRYASAGLGQPSMDLTSQFNHTKLTFDTGDPGLLGLPTNDWKTLVAAIGGQGPDSSGDYLFPCNSTMTFNFNGSEGRNYTFNLADITKDNGSGFCSPLANDAGDTTNWITGVPFFEHYYTAWYYGNKGVGSTLGLGWKNLNTTASQSTPVVGYA